MRIAIAIGLIVLFAWNCSSAQTPTFDLPNDFYPILSWDLPHWSAKPFSDPALGVRGLRDCGFNTAAFVRPEHLKDCERLGVKCILAAPKFPIPWRTLSDAQIELIVRTLVGEGSKSPAVIGYFLMDEPGAGEFPALAKAVAAVKKLAPGKLAYINLFPNYATIGAKDISQLGTATYADYLEQYVSIVHPQFISYDNYQIVFSGDQRNAALAASYYTNLLEVRGVAMKNHIPFWQIVSSNQLTADAAIPSPANLSLQAYTTLAAGAKGLTWYTYFSTGYLYAPIDGAGKPTATWSMLRMVNEQIATLGPIVSKLVSTGVYFTDPQPAAGLGKLPGEAIASIKCATPLMVGEFKASDGSAERYAMIVNLSLRESTRFELTLVKGGEVQQYSPVDGSLSALEKGNALRLTAGQGVLVRIATK